MKGAVIWPPPPRTMQKMRLWYIWWGSVSLALNEPRSLRMSEGKDRDAWEVRSVLCDSLATGRCCNDAMPAHHMGMVGDAHARQHNNDIPVGITGWHQSMFPFSMRLSLRRGASTRPTLERGGLPDAGSASCRPLGGEGLWGSCLHPRPQHRLVNWVTSGMG